MVALRPVPVTSATAFPFRSKHMPRFAAAFFALALVSPICLRADVQPTPAAAARSPEEGRPFIRTYRPFEIGGGDQNWAIVQDPRGIIYVGSTNGVLEFDGASWRLIETKAGGTVRSLAIDDAGRIYAGSVSDFGYLRPDEAGEMRYVSLLDKVPADARAFGDVWRTFVTKDGVLFQAPEAIFRWANGRITVIRPVSLFNRMAFVNGDLYITTPEAGLNVMEGDTFRPLPGTQSLANELYGLILPYDKTRLLIGTIARGLFLYDGTQLTPFRTELDQLFMSSRPYRGVAQPEGTFVLAMTNGGIAIIDRDGRRVTHVSVDVGLPSNTVYFVMPDREGALWLGLDTGVARVETPSPSSFFESVRLIGNATELIRHEGRLYVAATGGGFHVAPADATHTEPRFERLSQLTDQCWSFMTVRNDAGRPPVLLLGCSDGLFEISGNTAVQVAPIRSGSGGFSVLRASKVDKTRLWAGSFSGLQSFRHVNGRWVDEGVVDGIVDQVRTLYEEPDGSLWAGTAATGLIRLSLASPPAPGTPRPTLKVERFGRADGLSVNVAVQNVAGSPRFVVMDTDPRVMRFDRQSQTFVRDPSLDEAGFDRFQAASTFGLWTGPDGRVYANFGRGTAVFQKHGDGKWDGDLTLFGRFGQTSASSMYAEQDGVVWFTWQFGPVVRFDTARAAASGPPAFSTFIRRVTADQTRELFGGASLAPAAPELAAGINGLRFEFGAPSFIDEGATEYQSRLDGFDHEWSPWSAESRRDYTNLGFGEYRFRVRARNVIGQVSEESAYAFTILPPWYRTWPAYVGYAALAVLAMAGAAGVQRHRVVAKERQRAQMTEARLRAEAAESLARSESEGKRNVELLSDIGREITASLDFDTIFGKLYERLNELADADVFGVGLYHPERQEIEYRLAIEKGKRYAPYMRSTSDKEQLPVWCIEHRQPVFINNLPAEYGRYISRYEEKSVPLEDGSMSQEPQSLIYLPLIAKEQVLGIITIQSFEKNAYTEHHLNVLQSLASYTAIALDNAHAYRRLNEHEHEIRRLFEEAQKARAAAEDADAAKSAFLSTVSHELRTPLTSVLGFAKIIKKRLEDRIFPLVPTTDQKISVTIRQIADNLKVVVSEGERLTKLIDDVLDLAKIEAGKLEWHMEGVAVADIIDRATAATSSLLEQKNLRLVKHVTPGLPTVTGDRDRLIQVVINLISNSVKFTDAGAITCRAARRGDEVVVSVSDTGVGIAPADQPKVFERFKQVGDTLTDKPKGTGLGLPICKEIIEHHGGRIWVESDLGRGSTFYFSLPATAEQLATAGEGPVQLAALIRQLREQVIVTAPRTNDRQPRILVVDDDANIRELLLQELTEAGYEVRLAANGREAVASVRRERPDLVVLDVMMPEMNGFDVAAVLKNDPLTLDIPIVILSIVQDRERGYRLGVDRYLTKPIDTHVLFKEVEALIEQGKSHKRVLVVDEDATTVKTLSDVLHARGYTVNEANGHDLRERAVALQPDIIMLSSAQSARSDAVRMLRLEKGLENVLFLVYQ
jgi:signal transduction histidine kinase/CheY-like chemotaxis protein